MNEQDMRRVARLPVFQDKARVERCLQAIRGILAYQWVSDAQLKECQEFFLELLEGLNTLRPHQQVVCGGNAEEPFRRRRSYVDDLVSDPFPCFLF